MTRPETKSILREEAPLRIIRPDEEDDSLDSNDFDEDENEDDEEDVGEDEALPPKAEKRKKISTAAKDRLAQDDAEIAELERKLGIKKGRKSLPQSFKDDGLDLLMGDLGDEVDTKEASEDDEGGKRKREYDDWLSAKRKKTEPKTTSKRQAEQSDGNEDDEDEGIDGDSGDDNMDSDDLDMHYDDDDEDDLDRASFDGFDDDEEDTTARVRENPYIAPTTGQVVAKYIPPSLRKAAGNEGEAKIRLRKQVNGLINRLTDANILSIVQSAEELYSKNARGDVTEMLTEIILAQVCKPESLPDQFFVLTGGFAAAIFKIIGASFGSHMVRKVVKDFGQEYEKASVNQNEDSAIPKEAANLLTFLSQLYVSEVVTCKIIFDYMERLLSDLTELNVELLLRICRMSGRLLRRDDPQALKHVSSVLGKSVAKVGYPNASARTKFMIETINGLKNSKPKAKGIESAVVSEHAQRMKKRLGELKSQSRRLEGTSPMGIGLEDVENADVRGKWWLVGASVPVKPDDEPGSKFTKNKAKQDDLSDSEDMDFVLPDYPKKARSQGLSTPAQIAIFTALLSATDYETGYRQFLNIKIKKDDQLEIARVIVQCVGSEVSYNPYYALVARQACTNGRIRFAFQNRLWQMFRSLGESLFGEEADDEETADSERLKDDQRISNVAHFYASLMIDGVLSLAVLKPLDLQRTTNKCSAKFVEWLFISLLQNCRSKKSAKEDTAVEKVFGGARDLHVLAAGVHWWLRKVRKSKLIGAKELKKLEMVREKADGVVQGVPNEDYL